MMADAVIEDNTIRTQIIALQDDSYTTSIVSRDVSARQKPSYAIAINQLDDLKTKNIFNLNDLEKLQDEFNRHLTECNDHHFQITQYKLNYGAGNARILTCPDGSINHFNMMKLDLTTKVLNFDIKRAKSLAAFYAAQKSFFRLIEKFKEVEMEIQQLLHGLVEHGITCESFRTEMSESKGRIAVIEESRVTRKEGWLEWFNKLL